MIPFNSLAPKDPVLAEALERAANRVIRSGWYILGPELEAFEIAFARYHGVRHAVGVANGTDAIELALRVADIGPGDEVLTVSHTAVATICAVERAGATPVLVDIDEATLCMDPEAAAAAVTPRTKAILPVHLYGHPAPIQELAALAEKTGTLLIEDCAQAHGAREGGRLVGTFGRMAAFSFYPTKNLGALGDAGAVLTDDDALANRLRRLRSYGQTSRYNHVERGVNSRLDEMQAALLAVKLERLDADLVERRAIAARYDGSLAGVKTPFVRPSATHAYHLYVVRHERRDALQEALQERGVGTLIHYPVPIHLQTAYRDLGKTARLKVTERVAKEILSLPLYPGLTMDDVSTVVEAIRDSA